MNRTGIAIFSLTLSAGFAGLSAFAQTNRYVVPPGTAGVNPGNGYTNWAVAATNIQDAVDACAAGDKVTVTNGTYWITNQIAVTLPIALRSVNGSEKTVVARVNDTAYTNRIFYFGSGSSGAILDGFTVSNGLWPAGAPSFGVGIYVYRAAVTVTACRVVNNRSTDLGQYHYGAGFAAAYGAGGSLVSNCVFEGNEAMMGAAAFFADSGVTTLSDCVISNNISGPWGITIVQTTSSHKARLINTTIINNTSPSGGTVGFWGENAAEELYMENCLIHGNRGRFGGGLYIGIGGGNGKFEAVNCTIVGNSVSGGASQRGGGIDMRRNGAWSITNCVIYGNEHVGGGVYSNWHRGPDDNWGSIGYTCAAPATLGAGNIDGDPLFVDAGAADFQLTRQSPCFNTGFNIGWLSPVDLAGRPRVQFGTVDMGAYENQEPPRGTIIIFRGGP